MTKHVVPPASAAGKAIDDRTKYLLATMRHGRANLATWMAAIDEIGVGLKAGYVTLDQACEELADLGLLQWLPQTRPAND